MYRRQDGVFRQLQGQSFAPGSERAFLDDGKAEGGEERLNCTASWHSSPRKSERDGWTAECKHRQFHHPPLTMPFTLLRRLVQISTPVQFPRQQIQPFPRLTRTFTSTPQPRATFQQVLRGCRVAQRARKKTSPQLSYRPEMKGVCIRVGITKPKKPNSGERKVARVRLSNGKEVTAYIPGEGTFWLFDLSDWSGWARAVRKEGG